jgi:hypothetical protein
MVNTQIRQLTSAEYYQMMESGIIREGEKVELILGQIFTIASKGTRRTVATIAILFEFCAVTLTCRGGASCPPSRD